MLRRGAQGGERGVEGWVGEVENNSRMRGSGSTSSKRQLRKSNLFRGPSAASLRSCSNRPLWTPGVLTAWTGCNKLFGRSI
jgi:hypothetical protein